MFGETIMVGKRHETRKQSRAEFASKIQSDAIIA
jgi:hypothetical protein